jgi:hypothetical protein
MKYNKINYLLEDTLSDATYYSEAYHPNYVKKNIVPDLANRFGLSNEQVFKILSSSDPTEDKRYMMFLASSWLLKREEDIETISEQLFKLIDLSKQKTKGSLELLHLLSLNKKKLSDLNEFVNKFKDVDTDKDVYDNFEKVLSEDGVDVYKITKFIKAPGKDKHVLFCDTNWCVAKEDMFDEYAPPYYLFIDSETKDKIALFHKESSQLKNTDDEPMYEWALGYKKIEKAFIKTLEKTKSIYLWGDDFELVKPTDSLCSHAIVLNFENQKHWRRIVNNETKGVLERVNDVYDLFDGQTTPYTQPQLMSFIQNIPSNVIVATLTIFTNYFMVDIYNDAIPKNKKKYNKEIDMDFTNPKTFDNNIIKAANIFKEKYKEFEDALPAELK